MLQFCVDTAAADWIEESGTPWTTRALFGPLVFDAYARLRLLPDPEHEGQRWGDARPNLAVHGGGEIVARACSAIASVAGVPERCFFAIWDGYSGVSDEVPDALAFRIPNRGYFLYEGAVEDAERWVDAPVRCPAMFANPPAMVWPSDRSWFIGCDTDVHWAGISASQQVIAHLVARDDMDVVSADPTDRLPFYRP